MAHNDNTEWEEFGALLNTVVPDTSESAQNSQSDASHDSQTNAQAQDELQSGCTYEDDDDLVEVDVDEVAMESQAEMETESGATAQNQDPPHKVLATDPVVPEAPVELSSGSSSTATIQSAEPHSEAAANRARATERGYLARRRAARKSASLRTAQKEAASQAGSETPSEIPAPRISTSTTTLPSTTAVAAAHNVALPRPQTGSRKSVAPAPTSVPTPSASSSTSIARPAPSSSRAGPSPATMPPPPPLPVGPTGRRQLWEGELKLGLPHLKAGYRIALPPARPASAPVVGATSAGPVPQVGARHQSAPVASTSSGKRSRDEEDRGERVVRKRAKATNSTTQSQRPRQPPVSSSIRAPQGIPYSAQQPGESRQREHLSASQPSGLPAQAQRQIVSSHQGQQIAPPSYAALPPTSTSHVAMQMSGTPRNINVGRRQAPYAVTPQVSSERSMQQRPVAGPSRRAYEQEQGDSGLQHPRNRAQTYAMPEQNDQAAVPRTFARAAPSTSRGPGQNAIVPQQPLPATPEAGPSRRTYQQPAQHQYPPPASLQSYMTPVPSGWNDPAAIPRTFARTGLSVSTMQPEGQSVYGRVQDAPVAYAARPQQQMERSVRPMIGGIAPAGAEWQLPNVDAPRSPAVSNQPYTPPMPMPAGWNSNAGGERVPAYLTMYAPPNHPPPGWNPQAPVYDQEPSAQSFRRGQSAYGYGYDF